MNSIPTLHQRRGFTLVELLVALSIMAVVMAIVLPSISEIRKNSRDKARMTDLAKLELVLRLYVEKTGNTIDCNNGLKIDGKTNVVSTGNCRDGGDILAFIVSQLGNVPSDPLGPDDDSHYYYFDNSHECDTNDVQAPLLFAVNMESSDSNAADVCDDVSGNDGGYLEIDTVSSVPHVRRLNFSRQGTTP